MTVAAAIDEGNIKKNRAAKNDNQGVKKKNRNQNNENQLNGTSPSSTVPKYWRRTWKWNTPTLARTHT